MIFGIILLLTRKILLWFIFLPYQYLITGFLMVGSLYVVESDIDSRGRYIRPRSLYQIQEKERYYLMNKSRRATLQEALNKISEARALIEEACNDEQEAFDNMPEGLQCSERGKQMEEYCYTMEEMLGSLEEYETELEEIIGG